MDERTCCAIAEFLSALSNPTRIRILCALFANERCVGEIAGEIGLSQAHTSSHLRVLYDRGYLSRRREGKKVYYGLRDSRIPKFLSAAGKIATGSVPGYRK
ncbi:ArsR family transcriptional regulator [Candidatus Acetothermia bacterium]|nr:MAG: ArsR family transcriptional regulator [Candidatus Acetothermia bacterium]